MSRTLQIDKRSQKTFFRKIFSKSVSMDLQGTQQTIKRYLLKTRERIKEEKLKIPITLVSMKMLNDKTKTTQRKRM